MLYYYAYFLIYAFLGWCMESTIYTYKEKRFVNRGFLNGPLCPVYGIGMVIIIFFLQPYQDNLIILFTLGMVLASALEYITGFMLETLFHARWWDYTKKKFNLQGYICLQNCLAWGVLCVVMINFIQPMIHQFVVSIPSRLFLTLTSITMVILVIDITFTLMHLVSFSALVKQINELKTQVSTKLDESNPLKELHQKLLNNTIELKTYIESLTKLSVPTTHATKMIKTLKSKQLKRLVNNYGLTSKNNTIQETLAHIKNSLNK